MWDQRDINAAKAFDQYGKPLYHENRMAGLTYLTIADEKKNAYMDEDNLFTTVKKNEALKWKKSSFWSTIRKKMQLSCTVH